MRICLDFDGVIHDPGNREPGYKMGKPVFGAHAAIIELQRAGHTVVIHTARVQKGTDLQHVYQWLDYFAFPAMPVYECKPVADVYVDDKGLRFTAWREAMVQLAQLSSST